MKGAATPPTPGTDAWWRAAVREAVYTLRQRGLVQYVGETETVNWSSLLINSTYAPPSPALGTAKNGAPFPLAAVRYTVYGS
jgi:hypothetical protein